jgi:hypothetical protein
MLRELLIKQYPKSWRDQYGDEMLAVLEDAPMNLSTILDTMRGAFDAHVDGLMKASPRRRRKPNGLLVLVVVLTLMAPPHMTQGPSRPVGLLPGFTR